MKLVCLFILSFVTVNVMAAEPITWSLQDANQQVHQFPQQAIANEQVTVLFFWATWCPYCKQLMPHIQSALLQYKDELNLKVYALNFNEDGDPNAYLQENAYSFLLFPEAENVAQKYAVYGTPGVLIFDKKGALVFDLRSLQFDHLTKKSASHSANSIRLAPYWAAEIRKVLDSLKT